MIRQLIPTLAGLCLSLPLSTLLLPLAAVEVKADLAEVKPHENADGSREIKMAHKGYDPADLVINPWLFPVSQETVVISTPPGMKPYRDMDRRKNNRY